MSLHNIAQQRYNEWEDAVRSFIHDAEKGHEYGWVEAARKELLAGMHLMKELEDPDVEDRERMMLLDELRAKTGSRLERVMANPALRGVGVFKS